MRHSVSRFGGHPRGVALLAIASAAVLGAGVPAGQSLAAGNAPAAGGARPERKVTLDFVQADVNDVAKALSVQAGLNVVLMPSVKGSVTVRLIGLSPEEALQRTAAAVGADVRKLDQTYYMGSTVELRAMASKAGVKLSVPLKYVEPDGVK